MPQVCGATWSRPLPRSLRVRESTPARPRGSERFFLITAGEGRSANRSKWAQQQGTQTAQLTSEEPVIVAAPANSAALVRADQSLAQASARTCCQTMPSYAKHTAEVCQNIGHLNRLPPSSALQVWQASQDLQPVFAGIDQLVGINLRRVQSAMRRARIGPHHFAGSTGYGHGDLGREAFEEVPTPCHLYIPQNSASLQTILQLAVIVISKYCSAIQ